MFCTNCGKEMTDADRFCSQCGKAPGGAAPPPASGGVRPLARDIANKKVAGVCAGLARHLGWDVTILRVIFLALVVLHGFGLVAYIIAWICMPRDDIRSYNPA